METVDHILSKMREPSCFKGKIPVERVDADFRDFADRLEAAIKREREAVGNMAKMRETLDEIRVAAMSDYLQDADYLIEKCNAALSAPARNCDVYLTKKERNAAYKKYREYVIMSNANPFIAQDEMMSKEEWLLAEAKGETK